MSIEMLGLLSVAGNMTYLALNALLVTSFTSARGGPMTTARAEKGRKCAV
jgi:hypothetical protein